MPWNTPELIHHINKLVFSIWYYCIALFPLILSEYIVLLVGVFIVFVVVANKVNGVVATAAAAAAAATDDDDDDDDAVYLIYYYLFVTGRQYNTTKEKAVSIWVPPTKAHTRIHKLHTISDDGSNHHLI